MIGLEQELTYTVRTANPLSPTEGSPFEVRRYWQITEAALDGPRIKARLASTGMDWMAVSPDRFWRPNVLFNL